MGTGCSACAQPKDKENKEQINSSFDKSKSN